VSLRVPIYRDEAILEWKERVVAFLLKMLARAGQDIVMRDIIILNKILTKVVYHIVS
jgi:hypothetical protein